MTIETKNAYHCWDDSGLRPAVVIEASDTASAAAQFGASMGYESRTRVWVQESSGELYVHFVAE